MFYNSIASAKEENPTISGNCFDCIEINRGDVVFNQDGKDQKKLRIGEVKTTYKYQVLIVLKNKLILELKLLKKQ